MKSSKLFQNFLTSVWVLLILFGFYTISNAQVNLDSGLVAYYPFNGNANDESGNGYHGTVYNATLTSDRFDKQNRAYYFNGDTSYIQANNFPLLNTRFTYSAWIKVLGTGQHSQNFACYGTNWDFGYNVPNHKFGIWDRTNYAWVVNLLTGSVWVHVAIVYDYNVRKLFFQGDSVASQYIITPISGPGSPLRIGQHMVNYTQPFHGKIDDIRIYNRALTRNEIKALSMELPPPILIFPPNSSIISNTLTPTLIWETIDGASYYHVVLSPFSNFGILTDSASVTTTHYTIPNGVLSNYVKYYWKVYAGNLYPWYWSDVWNFTLNVTSVKKISSEIPNDYELSQNYPNPFNPVTNIKFDLPKTSVTKLIVYDALGREVVTLVNEKLSAGSYEVDLDGSNYTSCIYFYRLEAGKFVETRKMILIK